MTPGGRMMHPGRLIMKVNVVKNDNSDNFYSDHKAVFFIEISQKMQKKRIFFFLFSPIKKIVLSDLILQLYNRNKSCQKCHFKQH